MFDYDHTPGHVTFIMCVCWLNYLCVFPSFPLSPSPSFKTSRYNCGPLHMKDKKRFEEKTREDMVKKARERRKEDIRAKELLHRQIQDDRK